MVQCRMRRPARAQQPRPAARKPRDHTRAEVWRQRPRSGSPPHNSRPAGRRHSCLPACACPMRVSAIRISIGDTLSTLFLVYALWSSLNKCSQSDWRPRANCDLTITVQARRCTHSYLMPITACVCPMHVSAIRISLGNTLSTLFLLYALWIKTEPKWLKIRANCDLAIGVQARRSTHSYSMSLLYS